MDVSLPVTEAAMPAHVGAESSVEIPQYRKRAIAAVWAAAALPMAALAWLAAPALKDHFAGTGSVPLARPCVSADGNRQCTCTPRGGGVWLRLLNGCGIGLRN